MRNDQVAKVARNDPLIIGLGNMWMKRNVGNRAMRRYYTSSIMRLVAKLLMNIRSLQTEENKKNLSLSDYIKPKYYKHFVRAALICCGPDPDSTRHRMCVRQNYDNIWRVSHKYVNCYIKLRFSSIFV